jgi:anti-sigma factor RsiW
MKTDACRDRRESLGAYALGHLSDEERAGLEAHLEGCPSCRAELEQLAAVVRPMSLADPARFESAPQLPASPSAARRRPSQPRSSSSSSPATKWPAPSSTSPSPRCRRR